MGFFNRIFGGKTPDQQSAPESLPQLCYGIAYILLPQLLREPERVIRRFTHPEFPPGPWFYMMGCSWLKIEGTRAVAETFSAHSGELHPGLNYYIIQYPTPPPFDMNAPEAILAPYFSAILHSPSDQQVRYFTLGQGPLGGTTLRSVTPEVNANLGPGPEPQLEAFLKALRGPIPPPIAETLIKPQ